MYGFNDFTAGDTFGASDADGILRQTVMWFANAAGRDSALTGVLEEGLLAGELDTNRIQKYSGTAWEILHEPVQSWSPTLEQAGTVTATVNWGSYQRSLGSYWATCKLTVTATGSSGNIIAVSTPITQVQCHGRFDFWDDSIGWYRSGGALPYSTTRIAFVIDQGTDYYGIHANDGLTADDVIWLSVQGTY